MEHDHVWERKAERRPLTEKESLIKAFLQKYPFAKRLCDEELIDFDRELADLKRVSRPHRLNDLRSSAEEPFAQLVREELLWQPDVRISLVAVIMMTKRGKFSAMKLTGPRNRNS